MKPTPTQLAHAYGYRNYRFRWITFTKAEQARIIRSYIAGHRNGKGKR